MGVNPFFHRGAIRTSADFFGRQLESRQVVDLLRNGQSVALVAPRRLGKTSLLFHLLDPAFRQQQGLATDRYCCIYLNGEGWSMVQPAVLYLSCLEELHETLTQTGYPNLLLPLPTAPVDYRTFAGAIRTVTRQGLQLILIWDEFDALSVNPHLDADFFSGLRALATQYGVAYVTASTESLLTLTYANRQVLSSPFFNIFAQVRLRLFTPAEATTLLVELATRGGVTFAVETIAYLLDLAGWHPLYLQIAGYHAYEQCVRTAAPLTTAAYAALHRAFCDEVDAHWRYAWSKLTLEEQKYLALLPLILQTQPTVAQWLETHGVVKRQQGLAEYLSPTFQTFVAQQAVAGLLQAPPLTLEPIQRTALQRGRVIKLSPAEFDLLALLIRQEGRVLSVDEILLALWPTERDADNAGRLKDVLKGLRRLLDKDAECIQNVRGQGYFFRRLA